jgi:hypothetical protein
MTGVQMIEYLQTEPRQNVSPTEVQRDILPALTQLSLGRLLLSRARLRFTGRFKFNRSIAAGGSQADKIFFLPCHASKKPLVRIFATRIVA